MSDETQTAANWLLVAISTASAPSSLRVYVWRKLRELGGLYLQQQVCAVPRRPATEAAVARVTGRVTADGGESTVLRITVADPGEQRSLVQRLNAEREDEYHEFLSRILELHVELETERSLGRATFTEVDESRADLERFQRWLARIRERDWFHAPSGPDAEEAVTRAAGLLDAFEAEAVEAELSGNAPADDEPTRSRPQDPDPIPSRGARS